MLATSFRIPLKIKQPTVMTLMVSVNLQFVTLEPLKTHDSNSSTAITAKMERTTAVTTGPHNTDPINKAAYTKPLAERTERFLKSKLF